MLWLGATYVREVPLRNYPKLGRDSLPVSAQSVPDNKVPETVISLEEDERDDSLAEAE